MYTERAPRRQQFYLAPAIQQQKQRCQYTTSVDTENTRYERLQSLIQNHIRQECSLSARERRIAPYKGDP